MKCATLMVLLMGMLCCQLQAQPKTLTGSGGLLNDIAFFADGSRLLGGGADGMVRIWNVSDDSIFKSFDIGGEVTALALAPDGSAFAAMIRGREIFLIDIPTGNLIHRNTEGEPQAMFFTPDSKGLIFAIRGGQMRRLELATKQSRDLFSSGLENVRGMTTSVDGKLLAMCGSPPPAARGARSPARAARSRRGLAAPAAPASAPGRLVVFDISAGLDRAEQYVEFPVTVATPRSPAFSADGQLIAVIGARTQVWSMLDGSPRWALEGGATQLSLAFAPDSKSIFVGGADSSIRQALTETGRETGSHTASGAGAVSMLRFSPDGKIMAAIRGKDVVLLNPAE